MHDISDGLRSSIGRNTTIDFSGWFPLYIIGMNPDHLGHDHFRNGELFTGYLVDMVIQVNSHKARVEQVFQNKVYSVLRNSGNVE